MGAVYNTIIMRIRLPLIGLLGLTELITISACASAVFLTYTFYNARILPNTTINKISVGGLTIEQAAPLLQASEAAIPEQDVIVAVDDIKISSGSGELGMHYNYNSALREAFISGKQHGILGRFGALASRLVRPVRIEVRPSFDEEKLTQFITELKLRADIIGEQPGASLGRSGDAQSLKINAGLPGRVIEIEPTILNIQEQARAGVFITEAAVASTSAQLTDDQVVAATARAKLFIGQVFSFTDEADTTIKEELNDQSIMSTLLFPAGLNELGLAEIVSSWADELNRPAQDAVLTYDSKTLKVSEFVPDKPGLAVNREETLSILRSAITDAEKKLIDQAKELEIASKSAAPAQPFSHSLSLQKTQPEKTLAETNDLGIATRIGFGESEYAHSIPNRIHNVKITAERVTDIIVPPDTEFSFNKTLGEVSARTGYKSAYVIRNGRTELGDGGGVCQVSTTVFRAALNAGLPITKRIPHSYRVSYYELDSKPGIDATVYSGNIDLRFKNDTGHAVLIHTKADSENLTMYVELYGTSDGRSTEIVDHVTWDYRSPPPAEFYPDPTLPPGTKKQIDWAAAGIKAKFKNIVKDASGKTIREEEYTSNYKPWSAKYLVGP